MNSSLFSEFSSSGKEAWKQQAIKDLKGRDYDQTLRRHTSEGFVMEPYYTHEEIDEEQLGALQRTQQKKMGWLTQPVVTYVDEKTANELIHKVLQKGADALTLDLSKADLAKIELTKLLKDIKLSDTPIFFRTGGQNLTLLRALQKFIAYRMKGGLTDDGLAEWMMTAQLPETYFQELAILSKDTQHSPQFRTVCVSSHVFHNAGANAVQELAFTLASAVEYMDKLTDFGLSPEEAFSKLYFSISIGTNYFMEIAKLRALRYLWNKIQRTWKPAMNTFEPCYIHAQTSTFYDAAVTPNTNWLRATTEAMSAVIGGCDALTVHGYDAVFRTSDAFSERIALNLSTLMKEESHLDKTTDPAAGSYFLENLTLQLIETAWNLFLEVEQKGGLAAAFKQNFIQEQIEQNFHAALTALRQGTRIMVGVNKFRFDEEPVQPPEKPEIVPKTATFKLLTDNRLSQFFEQ